MVIRKTDMEEIGTLMELYANARIFMAEHGNPNQWGLTYPERSIVEADIREGHSYVCETEEGIAAAFFFHIGEEACYREIVNGQWMDDESYGVVHRIVSDGKTKGAASFCLSWAYEQCKNVRIDTHRDNYVMQNLLQKLGFHYCGLVYMEDGAERIAYQKK